MVVTTRRTAGKGKVVKYEEQDSDDDVQMTDLPPASPKAEIDAQEPPMKKLRTGSDASSPTPSRQDLQVSEAEDDYEASTSKKRKLRKSAAVTKGKGKGKAKAQLDTLFDKLPTDVVYMIFSHLHPNDLLRLARTSRMLRSHLMAKARGILLPDPVYRYLSSFLSLLPAYGERREKKWIPRFPIVLQTKGLLGGPARDRISRTLTGSIAFVYVQIATVPEYLIFGPRAQKAYPDIPDVNMLLELLPHSNTGSSYRGKYYRIKDIKDIGAEWAALKKKGTDADMEEFKERKKTETQEIMTHGTFCKTWEVDRSILKRQQNRDMRQARREEYVTSSCLIDGENQTLSHYRIFTKLEALGYASGDVRNWRVINSRHLNTSTPLTDQRKLSLIKRTRPKRS
ncbi:hypothetical protein FRC01_011904 [Tulasnella sp. 417]|nr:hypothetical protein FRC01_011904 [Tulasnella sp. 417]